MEALRTGRFNGAKEEEDRPTVQPVIDLPFSFLPVTLTHVCSQAGWGGRLPALSGKKEEEENNNKKDVPVFPDPSASIGGSKIESPRLPDAVRLWSLV